jgi:Fibronectin type III domain
MEWLLLLALAPAILVPVVLLFGFAGCDLVFVAEPDPPPPPPPPPEPPIPPANLTAVAKGLDRITVSWENAEPRPVVAFHFVRKKAGQVQRNELLPASTTTVEDTGLDAETEYTYEVRTGIEGDTSEPSQVTARTFRTAFAVNPALVPTDQALVPGNFCFVQRIAASQLLADGGKVAITVRGAPAANVTINRIFISRPGVGNPWNSAADLTPVRTTALTLPDDQRLDLDAIDYNLSQTQDLIVAFDFTAAAGAANIRFVAQPGVTLFFKQGVQQAAQPIRDADFTTQPDPRLYLVVQIGVP